MVMPNRNGGRSPDWDDLPPSVRSRFAGAPRAEPTGPACEPLAPRTLARDLSGLALLLLCVALGNIAFLLLALWFIYG
jgi:hypothetical protein